MMVPQAMIDDIAHRLRNVGTDEQTIQRAIRAMQGKRLDDTQRRGEVVSYIERYAMYDSSHCPLCGCDFIPSRIDVDGIERGYCKNGHELRNVDGTIWSHDHFARMVWVDSPVPGARKFVTRKVISK